ncbi:alpha/beta hydrolase [Lentzea xinjiangensis]|uniref:alpha/beta hydrolase n=1 Tax=Lentzea xinjiangensis TaxID=402600 RepID=UPI001FE410CB|nr:alpha/beta hydrolase [Lentzea xinjiangensis]
MGALLAELPSAPQLNSEVLDQIRPYSWSPVEPLLAGKAIDRRDFDIDRHDGTSLPISVLSPTGPHRPHPAPCVYWMHGGGMVMGDRFSQIDIPLEWLDLFNATVVSVEYRLAPEFTGTDPVHDCYRGLLWVAEHATELGIDPNRIIIAGISAGGGLTAGVAQMARDLGGPSLAAQVLVCPMLDHRNDSTSSLQYAGGPGTWTREQNEFGWQSLLGGLEDDAVPGYVSPALAADLSGLPPTYVDAGTAEVFRDEAVAYATRIWAAGGDAELHLWAGGFHGFDALYPKARLSAQARLTRTEWLSRVLAEQQAAR